ncbi:MAG: T9SS type A sorting domain-containing protein [Bacillota bacterium]
MKKILLILTLLFSSYVFAQSEFSVNTSQDSTQRMPRVAGPDNNGSYVIVWQSVNKMSADYKLDILLQKYDKNNNKTGGEIIVNDSTAGDQESPAAAINNDGTLIVVWASAISGSPEYIYDIKAKIFKPDGTSSPEFLVNKTRNYTQSQPDVSIDKNGNFVIAWESWFQDGSDKGIFAQRYTKDWQKAGEEFQVNTATLYSQSRPCVRHFSDGRFIISWESWNNNDGYDVFAQIFNSDGTKSGNEFKVNQYSSNYQWFSNIAVNNDGSFAIGWCSWEQDGDDGGIYIQKFNSDYSRSGSEIRVNATTIYYQWLPRLKYLSEGKLAVVWSSWQTDGSREGIYYSIIDQANRIAALENRINTYTDSYQWEPDLITLPDGKIVAVWASWGQFKKDYDIIGRVITPDYRIGQVNEKAIFHNDGRTTSEIKVHILEPEKLTGNNYEVSFESSTAGTSMKVTNLSTSHVPVSNFIVSKGENYFYLTEKFDGVAVELKQVFKLAIDTLNSKFINNSHSNLIQKPDPVVSGYPLIAPIDIALIWGKTDTLADGSYKFPSDTAYNSSMLKEVFTPFRAYNVLDNKKVELVIVEKSVSKNKKWDIGEIIYFRTPAEYRVNQYNIHAQLNTNKPSGIIIMPAPGDTLLVKTSRPLSVSDKFRFSTTKNDVVLSNNDKVFSASDYSLNQNYPNPFNPATTLSFYLPVSGSVELKVFDLLGREVKTLLNDYYKDGNYSIRWNGDDNNGNSVCSGIYIYRMVSGSINMSKKMILLR